MRYIELKLIETPKGLPAEQKETISKVNNFLLKNKGLIGDFKSLRELVDHDAELTEDEIQQLLPLPLYIGLGGTLLAVIVTIFTASSLTDVNNEFTETLFWVLKIALGLSFFGLLLSFFAWAFLYRSAVVKAKQQKRRFYDFIHQEMDQQLSHNITSSIYALQANLTGFNAAFAQSMQEFKDTIGQMRGVFNEQIEVMRDLKSLDLTELSTYNIGVMTEIRNSMQQFEKFNTYLQQTNAMIANIDRLNDNVTKQLGKSAILEDISTSVKINIELNKQMIEVLHADLREIESRKKFMTDAVINVDHALQKSLEELKSHTQKKLNAIRDLTIKEEHLLEKRFANQQSNPPSDPRLTELLSALQELIALLKRNS